MLILISAVIIYSNEFLCTHTDTSLTSQAILKGMWNIKMWKKENFWFREP